MMRTIIVCIILNINIVHIQIGHFLTQNDLLEHCSRGLELFDAKLYSEAIAMFEGIPITPENFVLNDNYLVCTLNYAEALYIVGRRRDSIVELQKLVDRINESDNLSLITYQSKLLNRIGEIHIDLGEYWEALGTLQQARDIAKTINNHNELADALTNLGKLYYEQGDYLSSLEHFQHGLNAAILGNGFEETAKARLGIGQVFHVLGRYSNARDYFIDVMSASKRQGYTCTEAAALTELGALSLTEGQFQQAISYYVQAKALVQNNNCNTALTISIMSGMAKTYGKQGRYIDALQLYQRALEITRQFESRGQEADLLTQLAELYIQLGRFSSADETVNHGLSLAIELEDRDLEATSWSILAQLYQAQARYGQALDAYHRALDIAQALKDIDEEGIIYRKIADIYQRQGRYQEALEVYQLAFDIARRTGNRLEEALGLIAQGKVYETQGNTWQAADTYGQALRVMREVENLEGQASALLGLGRVHFSLSLYRDALAIYRQTSEIANKLGRIDIESDACAGIGNVYLATKAYDEAQTAYEQALTLIQNISSPLQEGLLYAKLAELAAQQLQFTQAISYYDDAMDLLETVRATAGSDSGRTTFIAQYADIYIRAINLNVQQKNYEKAFLITERSRARTFLDSLSTAQVVLSDNESASLLNLEQQLFSERQAIRTALIQAKTLKPPDLELEFSLAGELEKTEEEYRVLATEISSRREELTALIPNRMKTISLVDVQKTLEPQTTLVSYWMLGDRTIAFIISAGSFKFIELPEANVDDVRQTLDTLFSWYNTENPYPRSLRHLYAWLITPIMPYLQTDRITIIPHQELHYVPFAALTDGSYYFGQQFALSVLPSVNSLSFISSQSDIDQQTAKKALIFGNPQFREPELPSLTYAEHEAEMIASILDTQAFTSTYATEGLLWDVASAASVLHFAAHGRYNQLQPLSSTIYLAADEVFDGALEAREVFGLPLDNTTLVTLSACQTNIGELSRGDEVVGLTRAFFTAGASTVLSSLWLVDDAATEALMVEFYTNWIIHRMEKDTALQAAQQVVMENPKWKAPFYWSGFVLNGSPH